MENLDIRTLMKQLRVYNYEVAERLGVSEFTFCRWLRNKLPDDKKAVIIGAIKQVAGRGGDTVGK